MPIFMDRHDVSDEVTAEKIAQLHQKDLKIQDKFDCRGLTYWFDDKRKTAFCLIEAPDAKAIQKMHDRAHGDVPHSIIEVDPGIVESFLGRIQDPKKARNAELNIIDDPAFRTIMVITISTSGIERNGSSQFETSLKNLNKGIRKIIGSQEGNSVKETDFHYLISFKSVTNGVKAALEVLSLKKELSKEKMKERLLLKIGLNAGVPVTNKQSIFEDAIKLAERMCEILKGEVIVSGEVKELYNSENANPLTERQNILSLSREDEKFMTLLMDYLEGGWSDANLKLENFYKAIGCSKSQLYRKIISLTGKSPNVFIKDYRLNEALKLLRKNAGNVSEIAFETGFSSPSYFSKCFQKRYGHMPSDYLAVNAS